jgi:hypothetical protein
MVNLKIGKKTFEMKFISWDSGAALVPVKQDEPAAETSPALQKIIGVRHGDGKILRQFPPQVQPAAFDRRRLA